MYSFVAFSCCLAVAAASICCVPPQWTGVISGITSIVRDGKGLQARGRQLIAYDAVNKKIGVREYLDVNGNGLQLDVLMDFNSKTRYIRQSDGKCIKTTLGDWVDGCIMDNATVTGTNVIFGLSSNSLSVNSYTMEYGTVRAHLAMTASTCAPVMEIVVGQLDNANFLQNNHYQNITAGIDNPTDLVVPPVGCESAPLVTNHVGINHATGMIGKRSALLGF